MGSSIDDVKQQLLDMLEQQQQISEKQRLLQQQLEELEVHEASKAKDPPPQLNEVDEEEPVTMRRSSKDITTTPPAGQRDSHPLQRDIDIGHHNPYHPKKDQILAQQQQQQQSTQALSCSYFLRLRMRDEHSETTFTTYTPDWQVGNFAFKSSLWHVDKGYASAVHLCYYVWDKLVVPQNKIRCKITLMDPQGQNADWTLAEKTSVFDGSTKCVNDWARGVVTAEFTLKEMWDKHFCQDNTLLLRYDIDIYT